MAHPESRVPSPRAPSSFGKMEAMRLIGISLASLLPRIRRRRRAAAARAAREGRALGSQRSALDAEGKETGPPEQAALATWPEMRDKMAEV